MQLLRDNGISLVIDVRSKNGSRVLHFDEVRYRRLSALLQEEGIAYDDSLHLILGGLQGGKMTLGNFRSYTATDRYQAGLEQLKARVSETEGNAVIICCERDVRQCHRRLIGESLARERWDVVHLG